MGKIISWTTGSLKRNFTSSLPSEVSPKRIIMAQNDRASFQICFRKEEGPADRARLRLEVPAELKARRRRMGHVPVPHHNTETGREELDGRLPGFVPDPLFDDTEIVFPPGETHGYWILIETPPDAPAGLHEFSFTVEFESGEKVSSGIGVSVEPLCIREAENFPVTHWFYADALCDWYNVEPFREDFWKIARPYFRNLVEHGTNTILSPLFTPPTDGLKRPNQLLRIKSTDEVKYSFDWTDVKKWVSEAKKAGFRYFEWTHLFSQWGAKNAIPIYENHDGIYEGRMLWPLETPADSNMYRNFLFRFLPEFKRFLEAEKILHKSFFHASDEPHGKEHLANYRKARSILRKLAPWMKVMDALSEISFAEETDMPVSLLSASTDFREKKIPSWDYFCCGPRGKYLNRLMDTPLAKIRGAGWLLYKFRAKGFLHWGYNYWYRSQTREMIDPFTASDGLAWPGWACGDTFVVYPGENGPIDSIRWEVFSESLKDYALLETLGVKENDKILECFKSYEDFPKVPEWYETARAILIKGSNKKIIE